MLRRTYKWLFLGLALFAAAVLCWRLERAGQGRRNNSASQVSTNSAGTPGAAAAAKPGSPAPVAFSAPAAIARLTNSSPLKYRLSNTTNSVGKLARSDNAIFLENAMMDTSGKVELAIPHHLQSHGHPGAYIVQARGVATEAFRSLIRSAGGTITAYVPNNAYLVRVSESSTFNLQPSTLVQSVLPYEPYYKLKPALLEPAVKQQPVPEGTVVSLLVFRDAVEATEAAVKDLGGEVLGAPEKSPFGMVLRVAPGRDSLPALAGLAGVQEMELARPRKTANDLSRVVLGVSTDSVTTTNYLDLSGSNVTVAVIDTGVDTNHPDLQGRVFYDFLSDGVDTDGHGTFVAGIIGGSGLESPAVTNAEGSIMPGTNAQFRGKAPAVTMFSANYLYPDAYLQEVAAVQTNLSIANNSWSYGDESYDLAAASYDAAVRDALPGAQGSQPLVYVFPAGNGGGASIWDDGSNDGGTGGTPDTIQSPGTAKNVITVGAIEQPRNIANQVAIIVGTDTNGQALYTTNQPWLASTDSGTQVAGFSGRGNVGIGTEGDNGRFKPDVVAPGTFIISTRSTEWDTNAYYNPTSHIYTTYTGIVLHTNAQYYNATYVQVNAVGLRITVSQNPDTPLPFPDMPIYVRQAGIPVITNGTYDFVRTNTVTMPPDGGATLGPVDARWYFGIPTRPRTRWYSTWCWTRL